jgi:hypothetical protein
MRRNFTSRGLDIFIGRLSQQESNGINLTISSYYKFSNHKGQLHVNEKNLAEEVERFWKSIKTKKLMKISVSFGEIDWYDNMTDIYSTPKVYIERGLKKARFVDQEHGSIPKDWRFYFYARFADTTTSTPIFEVIKAALGSYFTPKMEKELKKRLKLILQKKEIHAQVYGEDEE